MHALLPLIFPPIPSLEMVKSPPSSAAAAAEAEQQRNEVKYKGVRKRKWGKYVCEIRLPNSRERIWLGSYETAEKAARAFDAALYCLRGPSAKFNFPDDPPTGIAPSQPLTPAEIQAVAHHHGNTYSSSASSSSSSSTTPPPPAESDAASPMDDSDYMDWSFLDVLGSEAADNAGRVTDFGLFHDPADMYVPSHLPERGGDDEDNYSGGNSYSSFLWSF